MARGRRISSLALTLTLPLSTLGGCATQARNRALEAVAKDWCMVLRASQVIPVYPLTEDLVPGDIFLVQLPVDRQHEQYEARGFLPLDNHLARLDLPDIPPERESMPHAAFPTYAFSVQRGAGTSLALPVQGVPVALGLLGASAAEGNVAMRDARTYGLQTIALHDRVREWARGQQEFLRSFAPRDGRVNYLRVVSRVYLAASATVAVTATQGATVDAAGGADLPFAPQGSLKLLSASSRGVALEETFAAPLAFGYLGFDMAIGHAGVPGPPIPTYAVLSGAAVPTLEAQRLTITGASVAYAAWKERARQGEAEAVRTVAELDALARLVPEAYPCDIMGQRQPGGPLAAVFQSGAPITSGPRDFTVLTTYRSRLQESIAAIERGLDGPEAAPHLRERLAANEAALAQLIAALEPHRGLLERAWAGALNF